MREGDFVAAIVEELGAGTEADHVGVVRRRPERDELSRSLALRPGGTPTYSAASQSPPRSGFPRVSAPARITAAERLRTPWWQ